MDMKGGECLIGGILVPDFANPRPCDVDVGFMRRRMETIVRFSGHPAALTLREHQELAALLAALGGMGDEVIDWALHHDHHEYATGDIVRPLKRLIGGARLDELQHRWDVAICGALGIPVPSVEVRDQVEIMDLIAMGIEWHHAMGRDLAELRLPADVAECCLDGTLLDEVLAGHRRAEIRQARAALARQD